MNNITVIVKQTIQKNKLPKIIFSLDVLVAINLIVLDLYSSFIALCDKAKINRGLANRIMINNPVA